MLAALLFSAGAAHTATAPLPSETTAYPYTYTNPDGSTTIIKAKPTRVVFLSIGGGGVEDITALGVKPVGAGTGFPADANGGELAHTLAVGTASAPDYEAIVGLNPDLIVVQSTFAPAEISKLQSIAPTVQIGVVAGPPSPTNPAVSLNPLIGQFVWEYNVRKLAPIFNATARANVMIARLHQRMTALRPFVKGTTISEILVGSGPNFALIDNDQDLGAFIQLAGGIMQNTLPGQPTPAGGGPITFLPALTATKLIVFLGAGFNIPDAEAIPLWSEIPAVKAGQVYYTAWGSPGPVGTTDMIADLQTQAFGVYGNEATLSGKGAAGSSAVDDIDVQLHPKPRLCWAVSTAGPIGALNPVVLEDATSGTVVLTLGTTAAGNHVKGGCASTVSHSVANSIALYPSRYEVAIVKKGSVVRTGTKITAPLLQGALGAQTPAFLGTGDTLIDNKPTS